MKLLALLLSAVLLSGCSLFRGETENAQVAVDLIQAMYQEQQLRFETLISRPIDTDEDGELSEDEIEFAVIVAAALAASDDNVKEELKELTQDRDFRIWASTVLGDLVLQRLEE